MTIKQSPWDWALSFRPHEAACLIAGTLMPQSRNPSKDELPADARPIHTTILVAFVMGLKYKAGETVDDNFPVEMTLTSLELGPGGAINSARFQREELHRWLNATGRHSEYSFAPTHQAVTVATMPAPASETPEQRRARWLDWYGKGERGAVQRVFERERLENPKADRSYIGKEIQKAKGERDAKKRSDAMLGQLVRDGKRVG
jgi:hypothetical protein